MHRALNLLLLGCLVLPSFAFLVAQPALVTEIAAGATGSQPRVLTTALGGCLFFADDGLTGAEPWFSDGTPGGTVSLGDLNAGPAGSFVAPDAGAPAFVVLGGFAYFAADDGVNGAELWRTNGTAAGTTMVADIAVGPVGSEPGHFAAFAGELFFQADDDMVGAELWKSDGTASGTTRVKDIYPGALAFLPPNESNPRFLTTSGSFLYFQANDGATGVELWQSDGTEFGTQLVGDLWSGIGPPFGAPNSSSPTDLVDVAGMLFFVADDGIDGRELWFTDGFAIMAVGSLNPLTGSQPQDLTPFAGGLVFSADDGSTGRELWMTDAFGLSLVQLQDVDPTPGVGGVLGEITASGSRLFFRGAAAGGQPQLWTSDGTPGGGQALLDLPTSASGFDPRDLVALAPGTIAFRTFNDSVLDELYLWTSDGTVAGTVPVGSVAGGIPASDPGLIHDAGEVAATGAGRLFLLGGDDTSGVELATLAPLTQAIGAALPLGGGCGPVFGVDAALLAGTRPALGQIFNLQFSGLTPGATGTLFFSAGPPAPILLPLPCSVWIDLGTAAPLLPFVTDGAGQAALPLPLPPVPSLAGLSVTLQSVILGTTSLLGSDLTNGLYVVLGF